MSDHRIGTDDLTDEQIERIVNSHIFQKGLAYSRLAEGISVLEDEDEIFDSMVATITKQHSQIRSEQSVRDVLRLFRDEVQTFTEPLVSEDGEPAVDAEDLADLYGEGADDE